MGTWHNSLVFHVVEVRLPCGYPLTGATAGGAALMGTPITLPERRRKK